MSGNKAKGEDTALDITWEFARLFSDPRISEHKAHVIFLGLHTTDGRVPEDDSHARAYIIDAL